MTPGAPWRIVELDLDQPIAPLQLEPRECGVALIVRRRGRRVGFLLRPLQAGALCSPRAQAEWIAAEAGGMMVQDTIRQELEELDDRAVDRGPMPTVTVAICTKDHPELAKQCVLAALRLRETSASAASLTEILVVDNAPSDDRTDEAVAGMPGVRYVREPRVGLDFARNRAIREATGTFVAFIDDDAIVDSGWLDGLADAWRVHPDAGAFTGLVLPLELETEAQVLFELHGGFRRGFARTRFAGADRHGNPWYPLGAGSFGAGCNMVFRTALVRTLGGFDEALDTGAPLPGGGDLDMFYRVARAGGVLVYEPALLVFHRHRRERAALRRQYYTWGLGFVAYLAKTWRSDPTQRSKVRRLVRWWIVDHLRTLARSALGRDPHPVAFVIAELLGGVVGATGTYGRSVQRSRRITAALSKPLAGGAS